MPLPHSHYCKCYATCVASVLRHLWCAPSHLAQLLVLRMQSQQLRVPQHVVLQPLDLCMESLHLPGRQVRGTAGLDGGRCGGRWAGAGGLDVRCEMRGRGCPQSLWRNERESVCAWAGQQYLSSVICHRRAVLGMAHA